MKGIKSTTENKCASSLYHYLWCMYKYSPSSLSKVKNKLGLCDNVPVQRSVTALLLGQVSLMAKEKKTFEVELCTYWCGLNNNSSIINSFEYCWLISSGPRTRARAAAVWMPPGWSQTSPLGLHRSRQSSAGPIENMCPCQTTSWKIQTHESLKRQKKTEEEVSERQTQEGSHLLNPICRQLALPRCSVQPWEQTVLHSLAE